MFSGQWIFTEHLLYITGLKVHVISTGHDSCRCKFTKCSMPQFFHIQSRNEVHVLDSQINLCNGGGSEGYMTIEQAFNIVFS